MKKRTDAQRSTFMASDAYSRTLPAFTVNLIVRDIERAAAFYRDVFGAAVRYADPDFAAMGIAGVECMLHADHTYEGHQWHGALTGGAQRGIGAELRLIVADPDDVERRAIAAGAKIIQPLTSKAHGLREVHVQDPDGYVWAAGSLASAAGSE